MAMVRCSDLALLALDLGKATFDNAFGSASTLQELVEDGALAVLRRAPLVPAVVLAALGGWIGLTRRVRTGVRETADVTYGLLRNLADPGEGALSAHPAPVPAAHSVSRPARAA
jgi:hypothetical protein